MIFHSNRITRVGAVLATVCLLANALVVKAEGSKEKEYSVKDFVTKDARLLKKVTLVKMHTALAELLQRLSSQAHVKIGMDATIPSSGADVSVCIHQLAVGDILASLQSIFSHKQAMWRWERSGTEGNFAYTFVETSAARAFAAKMRNHEQVMFEQQASLLVRLAYMTPKERQSHTKELAECLGSDDDSLARAVLKESEGVDRQWSGLRLFDQSLSADQVNSVIHDHSSIKLPLEQLSNSSLQFVQKLAAGNTEDVNGVAQPIQPHWVEFAVEPRAGNPSHGPHALVIMLDHIGGSTYVGAGLTAAGFSRQLYKSWMLPGDTAADPIESVKLLAPQNPEPEDNRTISIPGEFQAAVDARTVPANAENRDRAELRIRQAADAAPFNYIARLPSRDLPDTGRPYGITLAEFLTKYEGTFPQLMHKWRDRTLLITYPDWPFEDENNLSYATTVQMRALCKEGRGFLSLRALIALSSTLTPAQIDRASTEFPVLKAAVAFHPVFRLITIFPPMLQPEGAVIDDSLARELSSVPVIARYPVVKQGARAIRVFVYEEAVVQAPKWEARVEILNDSGKWIPVVGLSQRPHAEVDITK